MTEIIISYTTITLFERKINLKDTINLMWTTPADIYRFVLNFRTNEVDLTVYSASLYWPAFRLQFFDGRAVNGNVLQIYHAHVDVVEMIHCGIKSERTSELTIPLHLLYPDPRQPLPRSRTPWLTPPTASLHASKRSAVPATFSPELHYCSLVCAACLQTLCPTCLALTSATLPLPRLCFSTAITPPRHVTCCTIVALSVPHYYSHRHHEPDEPRCRVWGLCCIRVQPCLTLSIVGCVGAQWHIRGGGQKCTSVRHVHPNLHGSETFCAQCWGGVPHSSSYAGVRLCDVTLWARTKDRVSEDNS